MKTNTLLLFLLIHLTAFSQDGFVIDHTHTDLTQIPEQYITVAKSDLKIRYFRRSHGSQLDVGGMAALRRYSTAYSNLYAYNSTGSNNEMYFSTLWNSLDFENDTWLSITRNYLDAAENSEINVVMWAWSSSFYLMDEDQYLTDMETLIGEYGPGGSEILSGDRAVAVTFIFQTACGQRTASRNEPVYIGNQKIREHCTTNNRILFDFNDLECYDPDGNYYGDGAANGSYTNIRLLNDDLAYISDSTNVSVWSGGGNWGIEWMNRNPTDELTLLSANNICTVCEHSMGTHEGETKDNSRLHCVLKGRAAWWMWAKLAGWGNRSLTIEADQALNEENLDARSINLSLTGDTFTDNSLNSGNFQLNNVPPGLSVESVNYTDATHAVVNLAFDGTDFDADYTNFSLTVAANEISGTLSITSNELSITAYNESVSVVAEVNLTETNLNDGVLNLTLNNTNFSDNQLIISNFQLNNIPTGTSIESIQYINSTSADINLAFDGTDFDENINNFNVRVLSAELSGNEDLESDYLSIKAIIESNATFEIFSSVNLTESVLNNAQIQLKLLDITFNDNTLEISNFQLNSFPQGLSILGAEYVSTDSAVLSLAFDGTDFDTDYNDFSITILESEINENSSITCDTYSLLAELELMAFLETVNDLKESELNNSILNIILDDEFYNSRLSTENFELNNAPLGLSVDSVGLKNDTCLVLRLHFDGTDFKTDISNFSVTINENALSGTQDLVTNEKIVIADLVSSIQEINIVKLIELFPNPNSGKFNLKLEMDQQAKLNISIIDLSGKILYQENYYTKSGINLIEFDLTDNKSEMRILIAKFADKQIILPIIIK